MHNITFISTIHKENGKCNANELCKIIEKIEPEVVFLEALSDTYSEYQRELFSSWGVLHEQLEIKALQKYHYKNNFKYIPVLDTGLADTFSEKYKLVCKNLKQQSMIDGYRALIAEKGFPLLNSNESIYREMKMRLLEKEIINGRTIEHSFDKDIESYENSMIENIYSYCKTDNFKTAVFMCGVAHRKSIIKKIKFKNDNNQIKINWIIFGE